MFEVWIVVCRARGARGNRYATGDVQKWLTSGLGRTLTPAGLALGPTPTVFMMDISVARGYCAAGALTLRSAATPRIAPAPVRPGLPHLPDQAFQALGQEQALETPQRTVERYPLAR